MNLSLSMKKKKKKRRRTNVSSKVRKVPALLHTSYIHLKGMVRTYYGFLPRLVLGNWGFCLVKTTIARVVAYFYLQQV